MSKRRNTKVNLGKNALITFTLMGIETLQEQARSHGHTVHLTEVVDKPIYTIQDKRDAVSTKDHKMPLTVSSDVSGVLDLFNKEISNFINEFDGTLPKTGTITHLLNHGTNPFILQTMVNMENKNVRAAISEDLNICSDFEKLFKSLFDKEKINAAAPVARSYTDFLKSVSWNCAIIAYESGKITINWKTFRYAIVLSTASAYSFRDHISLTFNLLGLLEDLHKSYLIEHPTKKKSPASLVDKSLAAENDKLLSCAAAAETQFEEHGEEQEEEYMSSNEGDEYTFNEISELD